FGQPSHRLRIERGKRKWRLLRRATFGRSIDAVTPGASEYRSRKVPIVVPLGRGSGPTEACLMRSAPLLPASETYKTQRRHFRWRRRTCAEPFASTCELGTSLR